MSASNQLAAFNYAVQPLNNLQIKNITAAYTVSPSDNNFILNCSGATSYTITMPSASSLPSGFNFIVWNNTTTSNMTVTIDPNGTETIDSQTTLILNRGSGTQIICDGTNWQTGNKKTMKQYSENYSATAVTRSSATGNASLAIGANAQASGNGSLALGGFSTGPTASGLYSIAIGEAVTAASNYSTAIGSNSGASGSQIPTGAGATALGGSYASGDDSFAAAIANNTSTYGAKNSGAVAIGNLCTASGANSFALGNTNTASLTSSFAFGSNTTASGSYSMATGFRSSSSIYGKFAHASGFFSAIGDAQLGLAVLRAATTDATATGLTPNGTAASSGNIIAVPNNSAFAFTGTIIARQQAAGGSNYAAWEVKGAILRDGTAASTVLGSYNINVLSKTAGASAWDLTLSADTTNGGLAVTATGAATTNIRWVATIKTSEVTYA